MDETRDARPALRAEHELHQRRSGRNWGVLAALVGMVALIFAVSLVKVHLDPESMKNPTANSEQSWGRTVAEWWTK